MSTDSINSEQNNELHVVLGAGPLGRAVAEALRAQDTRVRIVNRSGRMAEAPDGAELRPADLYDPSDVRAVTAGAAAVYQCAQPEYTKWRQQFPTLMAAILEGLNGTGARLVFGDNLYMYGPVDGPLHEALPTAATTRKGRARAQVAEMVLEAHRSGRTPATIGRASDFFGPWVRNSLLGERVFGPPLVGKGAQLAGNIDLPHTASYIGDFGRALALLGTRDEALGQVWHIPNDQPAISQRAFATLIFEQLGKPANMSTMGAGMMRLGGLFIPAARETLEMMYEFEQPFVVDSSKFARTFGMKATPLREAIATTLAWYRTHENKPAK